MGGLKDKTHKRLAWEARDKQARDQRCSMQFTKDLQEGPFTKQELSQMKKIASIYDLRQFELLINSEIQKYHE